MAGEARGIIRMRGGIRGQRVSRGCPHIRCHTVRSPERMPAGPTRRFGGNMSRILSQRRSYRLRLRHKPLGRRQYTPRLHHMKAVAEETFSHQLRSFRTGTAGLTTTPIVISLPFTTLLALRAIPQQYLSSPIRHHTAHKPVIRNGPWSKMLSNHSCSCRPLATLSTCHSAITPSARRCPKPLLKHSPNYLKPPMANSPPPNHHRTDTATAETQQPGPEADTGSSKRGRVSAR